jgi:hypothetical protein
MAPRYAIYGLNVDWEMENHCMAPDVPVENLPKGAVAGHDCQLETGVQLVLDELKAHPCRRSTFRLVRTTQKDDGLRICRI